MRIEEIRQHMVSGLTIACLMLSTTACSTIQGHTPSDNRDDPGRATQVSPTPPTSTSTAGLGTYYQVFREPRLAQCVAELLGQQPEGQLTVETANAVTALASIGVDNGFGYSDAEHPHCGVALQGVTDLTGLSVFAHMQTLYLDQLTSVSDVTPLHELRELQLLRLNGTSVHNYSPLNNPDRSQRLTIYVNANQYVPDGHMQADWNIRVIAQGGMNDPFPSS